ncbi:MAG: branched-chain amino acid ABC transporter permease [Pseudotabrizicola sp.]|uniref:branched-chain amino acid ABC transporter permease n=1 Tax=Pseudotabrizicola sp. TaxID=2939647 RepID=UPI00272FE1C3|nr:branched-chain amino acid ABC transporter permease [Pseudotabrizicola sp.]MDP2079370.1 branched-chain amino acid ABC transporter permease [Pseudotabrizicola sp.]MDZ7573614.1 branched-chain amino acid ABC transporter permease [Pseudotabrizicola sp.]
MFRHTPLRLTTLGLMAAGSLIYAIIAGFFGLEILAEIAILAILVIALDLVAGFGGMVSLCHGALMGVGAYAFTVAANEAGMTALPAMVLAIALSAAIAFAIGAVCARSIGIYFIMATLAFGQMGYSFVFQSSLFGGDDGLSGAPRLDLSALGIDLTDSRTFAFYAIALVALAYLVAALTLRSGLGRSLVGLHHNEKRLRALGLTVWRAKATAFAISGAIAGLAGCLAAQHTQYISPGLMSWTVSGEALVVVILGGLGTLVGPILGAILFVVLKHEISSITPYWHAIVGLILIAVVMSRANGVFGFIEARIAARTRTRKPTLKEADADA